MSASELIVMLTLILEFLANLEMIVESAKHDQRIGGRLTLS